jgi:hypothetical protein
MDTGNRVEMSAQEATQSTADQGHRTRAKFPEPRGWAMEWVFAQEAAPSVAQQEPGHGNGTWEKFAEPRGWAMKWDGVALVEAEKRRNGRTPRHR